MKHRVVVALRAILMTALIAGGGVMVTTAPASAAAPYACSYPYVCLFTYTGTTAVEKYQVVTSGWQTFARRDIAHARNTRHDDVVLVRFTNGKRACLETWDNVVWHLETVGVPDGIRITTASSCSTYSPGYPVPQFDEI